MDLVLFVLSAVGLCGSMALLGSGVAMLRHHGNSVSTSTSKTSRTTIPLPAKMENGKHDVLTMLTEINDKLSCDEHTELMVVPEHPNEAEGI